MAEDLGAIQIYVNESNKDGSSEKISSKESTDVSLAAVSAIKDIKHHLVHFAGDTHVALQKIIEFLTTAKDISKAQLKEIKKPASEIMGMGGGRNTNPTETSEKPNDAIKKQVASLYEKLKDVSGQTDFKSLFKSVYQNIKDNSEENLKRTVSNRRGTTAKGNMVDSAGNAVGETAETAAVAGEVAAGAGESAAAAGAGEAAGGAAAGGAAAGAGILAAVAAPLIIIAAAIAAIVIIGKLVIAGMNMILDSIKRLSQVNASMAIEDMRNRMQELQMDIKEAKLLGPIYQEVAKLYRGVKAELFPHIMMIKAGIGVLVVGVLYVVEGILKAINYGMAAIMELFKWIIGFLGNFMKGTVSTVNGKQVKSYSFAQELAAATLFSDARSLDTALTGIDAYLQSIIDLLMGKSLGQANPNDYFTKMLEGLSKSNNPIRHKPSHQGPRP